jgi:hypothetical protein
MRQTHYTCSLSHLAAKYLKKLQFFLAAKYWLLAIKVICKISQFSANYKKPAANRLESIKNRFY